MSKTIQIREIPDEVHEILTQQAAAVGMSLNRFLLAEFGNITRRSRNGDVLRRARKRAGSRPSSARIVADIRSEREQLG
ncbi:MAG TPA: hypothetical protein VHU91_05830 [Mycobacteriales bacterium]|jgi:hypothetical protein|nr:hypothetical protein [Mycobacteriales bacterium]